MHSWDELEEFRQKKIVRGEWPTIPELFESALARFPERPCFTVFEPERKDLTYRQAYEKIMKGAALLKAAGLRTGDRVLVNGKNSPDWAIAYFAALFAGCVVVPIDNQMHADRCMRLSEYAKVRYAICDLDVLEKMKGIGGMGKSLAGGMTAAAYAASEFASYDPEHIGHTPIGFSCPCSKEHFSSYLRSLPDAEKSAMLEGAFPLVLTCVNCGSEYSYTEEETKELFRGSI